MYLLSYSVLGNVLDLPFEPLLVLWSGFETIDPVILAVASLGLVSPGAGNQGVTPMTDLGTQEGGVLLAHLHWV